MSLPTSDRFTSRVADYVRYRPDYPAGAIELLRHELGLRPGVVVADLGAGTGILTRQLLPTGASLIAVDPNEVMVAAARAGAGEDADRCRFVVAPAEATGLPDASVDAIVVAQAFHWFDQPRAAAEVRRVLRPGGKVALLWNTKRFEGSAFLAEYEALLQRRAPEFQQVRHENVDTGELDAFYGATPAHHAFDHAQQFGWEGVLGRVMSSSYAPRPGEPAHDALVSGLRGAFDRHARDGVVAWPYVTDVYVDTLR